MYMQVCALSARGAFRAAKSYFMYGLRYWVTQVALAAACGSGAKVLLFASQAGEGYCASQAPFTSLDMSSSTPVKMVTSIY